MPCILPDGSISEVGKKILFETKEWKTPEEITSNTNLPLFRVRSSLRELSEVKYVKEENGKFKVTEEGLKNINKKEAI